MTYENHSKPELNAKKSVDRAVLTNFKKSELEHIAFQETISTHLVGIITREGQDTASGTLIRYKKKRLILTADHVFSITPVHEARFAFRSSGNLETAGLRQFSGKPAPLLPGKTIRARRIVRDKLGDLCAVIFDDEEEVSPTAAFYDASTLRQFSLTDGVSLFYSGFPWDNSISVSNTIDAVGIVADHSHYDASLSARPELLDNFNKTRQFVVKYGWAGDLRPDGLSGAAVWCSRDFSFAHLDPKPSSGGSRHYIQSKQQTALLHHPQANTFASEKTLVRNRPSTPVMVSMLNSQFRALRIHSL